MQVLPQPRMYIDTSTLCIRLGAYIRTCYVPGIGVLFFGFPWFCLFLYCCYSRCRALHCCHTAWQSWGQSATFSCTNKQYIMVARLTGDIHDKLMHSFHNRQICSLDGFIVSAHRLSCPARPPSLHPTSAPSCSNPAPHAPKNSALPSPVIRRTWYTW